MVLPPVRADMIPYAIIPARLGSRRLPRKNIAPLGGRPLIEWTLEAATKSGVFYPENIYVSTESFGVGLLANKHGVSWAWAARIPEIANDPSRGVEDVLRNLEMREDAVFYVLLATSPFRSAETIRSAWTAFSAVPEADGLISLVEWAIPPHWAYGSDAKGLFPGGIETMREQLPKAYRHDGGHLILKRAALLKKWNDRLMVPFFPPENETLDIDTPQDLELAEFLIKQRLSDG